MEGLADSWRRHLVGSETILNRTCGFDPRSLRQYLTIMNLDRSKELALLQKLIKVLQENGTWDADVLDYGLSDQRADFLGHDFWVEFTGGVRNSYNLRELTDTWRTVTKRLYNRGPCEYYKPNRGMKKITVYTVRGEIDRIYITDEEALNLALARYLEEPRNVRLRRALEKGKETGTYDTDYATYGVKINYRNADWKSASDSVDAGWFLVFDVDWIQEYCPEALTLCVGPPAKNRLCGLS